MGLARRLSTATATATVALPSRDDATQPSLGDDGDSSAPNRWQPAPCPVCGSCAFWIDIYAAAGFQVSQTYATPHCGICDPPPIRTLVDSRIVVANHLDEAGRPLASWQPEPLVEAREKFAAMERRAKLAAKGAGRAGQAGDVGAGDVQPAGREWWEIIFEIEAEAWPS